MQYFNAGIKCKAENYVIFIPFAKEGKYLNLRCVKHVIFIYDNCFSTKQVKYILLKTG